jgi:transposase
MPVVLKKKLNIGKIEELYRGEKDKKVKIKYKAFLLLDKLDNNAAAVARKTGKDRTTIGKWVKQYNEKGMSSFVYHKPPGRQPRLNKKQKEKIKETILEKLPSNFSYEYPGWDGKSLSHHIKKTYGVILKVRQCQLLFHELGFTLQRARYAFAKADPQKQAKFKKEIKKNSKIWILLKK